MPSDAVAVENLQKFFPPTAGGWRAFLHPFARPTVCALAGISFNLREGQTLALVGANGAGKSTLLRILCTILVPSAGRAVVAGVDVEREPARARKQLGYHSGSDRGFYARLTALENLRFFAALNNLLGDAARRSIEQATELFGLGPVLDRQARTLSTGMIHRLGLARAVLHGPRILLLDEPTRSLDPLTAADFRSFLRQELVRRRGTTVLFASHSLSEVEEIADRVAILDSGRLLADDSPAGLQASTGTTTLEQAFGRLTRSVSGTESPS